MNQPRANHRSPLARLAARTRFFVSNSCLQLYRQLRSEWSARARPSAAPRSLTLRTEDAVVFAEPAESFQNAGLLDNLASPATPVALYLDLMKRILANVIYDGLTPEKFDGARRERIRREGGGWPSIAHTM